MKGETALRKLTDAEGEPLPKEARKTKDSEFDRIFKFYHDNRTRVELTDNEERARTRWEKAWFLLCNKAYSNKEVVVKICRLFNINKSTAYDDLRNAMMLFSDPRQDVKEAKRRIHEHQILKGARLALKEKDLAMHEKYMKQYYEVNGLANDSDGTMAEKIKQLKAHQILIVADMGALQAEAERLRNEVTMDVSHEEG